MYVYTSNSMKIYWYYISVATHNETNEFIVSRLTITKSVSKINLLLYSLNFK